MADYYALTRGPLPVLHGADGEYSIRTLVDRERLAIEDYFFRQGARVALDSNTTAVVVPQNQTASATLGEYAVLVEFALGVLAVSGFEPISIAANLDGATCIQAVLLNHTDSAERPAFPKRVVKATASAWLRHLFAVRRKIKERLHITADRFARYLRDPNSCDALVDLCIFLESLIDTQTEVSFKFSTCLAKITGTDKLRTNK